LDVDEDRQPTKTVPRTIPEGGPLPLHRDTTISCSTSCGMQHRPLAFTRYSFTPKLSCTRQLSCYCPAHLHCPHDCNTIAKRLRRTRPPALTRLLYAIHHTILVMAISCKGQIPHTTGAETRRERSRASVLETLLTAHRRHETDATEKTYTTQADKGMSLEDTPFGTHTERTLKTPARNGCTAQGVNLNFLMAVARSICQG